MTDTTSYWVVGRLRRWESFEVADVAGRRAPVRVVDDSSVGAVLVYATREAAEAAADGCEVFRMVVGPARKEPRDAG